MADGASKGYFGGMSMTGDQIRSLQPALAAHLERFRHCFKRVESFRHWQQYISGLIMLLKRKSIEPIALAIGVPVRTLQEFLAFFAWDHELVDQTLRVMVAEEHASDVAIGVVDASAHAKSGDVQLRAGQRSIRS
jgi:SRSO17 transposase